MLFAIGIILAFISWALKPRGLDAITAPHWRLIVSGACNLLGVFLVVISIAIMAWGNLP